jgi:hypothetical protein
MKGLCLLPLVVGACAATDSSSDPTVGSSQEALGEDSCRNAPADHIWKAWDIDLEPMCNVSYALDKDWIESPGKYGSSKCPAQFVVTYPHTPGYSYFGGARWAGALPDTQAECERSFVAATLYDKIQYVDDKWYWSQPQTQQVQGSWDGVSCTIPDVKLYDEAGFDYITPVVRIAAEAWSVPMIQPLTIMISNRRNTWARESCAGRSRSTATAVRMPTAIASGVPES